jgi:Na+/H+ ion antiporter subunit
MSRRNTSTCGAEIVSWWVALTGLWLLTLSTVSGPELAAAAVLALPCAVAARAARHATDGSWTPKRRWARWFARVPVVRETWRSLRVRRSDRTESIALPDEPASTSEARQALATVAIGLSPGSMVVDAPNGSHVLVVHRLFDGRSPAHEEVGR